MRTVLASFLGLYLITFASGFLVAPPTQLKKPISQIEMKSSLESNDSSPYQHIKAVIFDIDGTLADSWKLGFDSTVVVLEKNSIPTITAEIYHEYTKYATPERLARHAGLVPGDADFESVGEKLGKEFDDLYVDLVSTDTAGFYPGVDRMLENIPSAVVLGALTNACVAYADAVFKANSEAQGNNICDRFLSVRGADNVPAPKPNPDGLLEVCKDLGLSPEQCIYVGDSPSDAGAAVAAGMPAIGVLWGSHGEEAVRNAPFSHVCQSIDELDALLPKEVLVNN